MDADSAAMAARLFAVDPVGLGGVLLQAPAGPARDAWLHLARGLADPDAPWLRVPAHIDDDSLLGGLDLAASLAAGRRVRCSGVLREAHGGVLVLCMAERLASGTAARIAGVQDTGRADAEPARWGLVALDESEPGEAGVASSLAERLALHVRLAPAPAAHCVAPPALPSARREILLARQRLAAVVADDAIVTALCEAAQALGVDSMRAACLALRAACAAAALRGSGQVQAEDAAWAARLVLGPRASAWPAAQPQADADAQASSPADSDSADAGTDSDVHEPAPAAPVTLAADTSAAPDEVASAPTDAARAMQESLVEAAAATLPPALLAEIASSTASGVTLRGGGQVARSGRPGAVATQGRPLGARRGDWRGGARLDLLQTLAAAAPWQALRRRERAAVPRDGAAPAVLVRRDDIRVRRYRRREERTTVFAVDASGSQALHRLAEAKGAAELLLADCYVRRDRVAVLAFRGETATVLLAPTRSLVRAKRCLAGLPGGGATPLATGLDAARQLAQGIVRQGGTPLLVLLTDGKANMTRAGQPGRTAAQAQALDAARAWRETGVGALLLDTAPEPQPRAQELAGAMQARYMALPHADSRMLATAVALHRG